MNNLITVETDNGPVELTARAMALNIERFEIKESIERLARRAAATSDLEALEEIAEAISENIAALRGVDRRLSAENEA